MSGQPQVTLPHGGLLRGTVRGGADAFLGIRYASAERFEPAQPEPAWSGPREATEPGPLAPQSHSRLERILGPQQNLPQDEDCLNLNVWTPTARQGARPVLVFIHGGGFLSGGGGLDWYHGAALAGRGDLVVVTINYRQGFLGFGSPRPRSANNGLRDALVALRWVRNNIAAFGGDPDRVTVSGQSGGAYLILTMLGSSRVTDLFHGAILQSTPAGMTPQTPDQAREVTTLMCQALGIDDSDRARLCGVPVSDVLDAQVGVLHQLRNDDPDGVAPPFIPVIENKLVAADLVTAAGRRAAGGKRVMIGTNRDEGTALFNEPASAVSANDRFIAGPSSQLADLLADNGNPALVYQFDWYPKGNPLGATHCIELPFQFGTTDAWAHAPMLAGSRPDERAAMTEIVQRCWTAFTLGATPHTDWQPWQRTAHGLMHLSTRPS